MVEPSPPDVTHLLLEWNNGSLEAKDKLFHVVYTELRRLASAHVRNERSDHTLQTTDLVHEAYIRLIQQPQVQWQSRAHFFAMASQIMRNLLVDHFRRQQTVKRGGQNIRIEFDESLAVCKNSGEQILALHQALLTLETLSERQSQIVQFRFFGGMSAEETAEVLQISLRSVNREWSMARAWLIKQLTA